MFKKLIPLLFAVLLLPMALQAQTHYVVSVGGGTATNCYVPDYGYYNYSYAQCLYTADEVGIDGDIDTIAFQVGSGGLTRNLSIYMAEVSQTSFSSTSSAVPASAFHLVYSGSVGWTSGWVTIALDSTFTYQDTGSLAIAVIDQTGSYQSGYPYFTGTQMSNTRSLYAYNDNNAYTLGSSLSSSTSFLPNIRIGISSYSLYCAQPSDVAVSGIHDDEATFSWHENGGATEWEIVVSDTAVADLASAYATTVYDTTYTVYGLDGNTQYYVYVRAVCSGTDYSGWTAATTFRSACSGETAIPYSTGFEDLATSELPNCWQQLMAGSSSASTFPAAYAYAPNARSSNVYFEFESSTGETELAALPAMSSINMLQFTFYASLMNHNFTLQVGVMEDTAFVPVQTIALTPGSGGNWAGSYYPYTVYFNNYTGSGDRIAMRVTPNSGVSSYTLMMDDFTVDYIPNCVPVSNLTASYVGPDTVVLEWQAGGTESSWLVSDGTNSYEVYDTTYTFDNLNPSSNYTFTVWALCGDTSDAVSLSLRTACGPLTALPFQEDFSSYASSSYPDCWTRIVNANGYPYVTTGYGQSLMFGGMAAAISPRMPALMNQMVVSFDLRREGSSSGDMEFGYTLDPNSVDSMVVLQTISISTYSTYFHYEFSFPNDTCTQPVYLVWRPNGTSNWYHWLDNVVVEGVSSCSKPLNFHCTALNSPDSLAFEWSDTSNASAWQIFIGTHGSMPVEDSIIDVYDSSYVFTGLTMGTSYDVYLRTYCSDTVSAWVSVLNVRPGSYNMPVTGTTTIHGCGLTIYDNGGPDGDYDVNCNATVTIYSSEPDSLFVLSGTYRSEGCCDYLYIYDGNSTSGNLLYSGYSPSSGTVVNIGPFTSYTGAFTIRFTSDGSVVNGGFELSTNCVAPPDCDSVRALTVHPGVTSAFVQWNSGTIGSYSGANVEYCLAGDSTWTLGFTTNETFGALTGLTANTAYQLRVIPICGEGNGPAVGASFTTIGYGCAEIDTVNSVSDTIGNGTSTNSYIPSYSTYNYGLSQQIYTAAELGHGGAITAISVMPSAISQQRTYEIYMAHTSQSSLSSFIHPSDMVRVYDGAPLTLTANQWITFQLDSPFIYSGSENLLVCFRDMTGAWVSGNSWYVHSNPNGNSVYSYQDAGAYDPFTQTGGTTTGSRNNMIFDFMACAQTSTCPAPVAQLMDVQAYSVTVAWAPGDAETSWNLYYRMVGDSVFTSVGTTTSMTHTFTGLYGSTEYEFKIEAPCAGSNDGATILRTFTECGGVPLPYTEDFESQTAGSVYSRYCWYTGSTNLGTSYANPTAIHLTGDPNTLCLIFNGGYLIMPEMSAPLNQLQIRFNFVQGADSVRFIMGVLPTPTTPIDSIHVIDTLMRSDYDTSAYAYVIYPLNGISDTSGHITFWDAFADNYSFIDNIVVEYIPNCTNVSEVTASNVTGTSAVISWAGSSNATGYIVEYGTRGFTSGTGTIVTSSSTSTTLSGLNPGISYNAYVYAICGNDTSIASQVCNFTTSCAPYTALPYTHNFENVLGPGDVSTNVVPNCWASALLPAGEGHEQPHVFYSTDLSHAPSPQYCFYFEGIGIAALPEMGVPLDSLMITFHEWNSDPSIYGLVIGAVDDIDSGFASTFVPIDTIPFFGTGNEFDVVSILNSYTGTARHIAIASYNTASSAYADQYLDNLVISRVPDCIAPMRVRTNALTHISTDLIWDFTTAPSYNIEYGVHGFTPGTGTTLTSTTTSVTLTGLTPYTQYDVYLVSQCSPATSSDTTFYTFTTLRGAPVTSYPYICSFADTLEANAWVPVNDGQTNGWYLGSAAHYGSADNMSIYVSNSNGTSHNYSTSNISFSYIYRTFALNAGSYNIGFNWQANGESNYDYIRAWLAPASVTFIAGQTPDGGTSAYNYTSSNPAGWIPLDGGSKLNQQSTWQTRNLDVSITEAGNYNLVFMWANDGSGGSTPPGAIDNVEVSPNVCRVTNVRLDTSYATSDNQLAVTWDPCGADYYEVAWGSHGFAPSSGMLTAYTTSAIITGLSGLTSYDVCVRGICNGGADTGRWERASLSTDMCPDPLEAYSYDSTMTASTSSYGPMGYSFYNYGYVQTLIDSAQIADMTDPITAFAFNPSTANQGNYYSHMTIYMANVPEADLSAGYIHPDSNHVFVPVITDRDMCYTTSGWQLHGFDTTFTWDGHSNVLFVVDRRHGSYSSGASFNVHNTSSTRTRYSYQDSGPYDINSVTGGSTDSYVGDLHFFSCPLAAICRQPVITSVTQTYESATITWTGTGTEYNVNIKESMATDWPVTDLYVSGNTYTFTGLTPATNYTFRVRQDCSIDTNGVSAWVIGNFVTDSLPCLAPDSLIVITVTNSTSTLAWLPFGNETAWDIHVWNSGGIDSIYTVNAYPATVGGFTANTTYNASVRPLCGSAHNIIGEWSDTITFSTAVCPDVTGLGTRNATSSSVEVYWNPDPLAQSWIIEYGFHGFDLGTGTQITTALSTYVVTGLMDDMEYDFRVRAVCGSDWQSEGWASTTATTEPGGITCNAPTAVSAVVAGNAATISWTPGEGNISFELEYGTRGFAHGNGTVVTATASPVTLPNLEYETNYDVYVRGICANNTPSGWSTVTSFTTEAQGADDCDPVSDLAASNVTESAALLTWTPGNTGDEWEVVLTNASGATVSETSTTEHQYQFTGLTPGTAYVAKVRTACGDGQYSTYVSTSFTTIAVGIDDVTAPACTIYPNPTSSATTISVSGISGKVRIAVVDMNGREVVAETLDCAGDCAKTMDVDKLAQGAYFVRITGENANLVKKLIVR